MEHTSFISILNRWVALRHFFAVHGLIFGSLIVARIKERFLCRVVPWQQHRTSAQHDEAIQRTGIGHLGRALTGTSECQFYLPHGRNFDAKSGYCASVTERQTSDAKIQYLHADRSEWKRHYIAAFLGNAQNKELQNTVEIILKWMTPSWIVHWNEFWMRGHLRLLHRILTNH